MVGIAIEEGGQKAEEFALLDDLGLFGKYWRPKGREGDTLKLNKPVEVVSTKGSSDCGFIITRDLFCWKRTSQTFEYSSNSCSAVTCENFDAQSKDIKSINLTFSLKFRAFNFIERLSAECAHLSETRKKVMNTLLSSQGLPRVEHGSCWTFFSQMILRAARPCS